ENERPRDGGGQMVAMTPPEPLADAHERADRSPKKWRADEHREHARRDPRERAAPRERAVHLLELAREERVVADALERDVERSIAFEADLRERVEMIAHVLFELVEVALEEASRLREARAPRFDRSLTIEHGRTSTLPAELRAPFSTAPGEWRAPSALR